MAWGVGDASLTATLCCCQCVCVSLLLNFSFTLITKVSWRIDTRKMHRDSYRMAWGWRCKSRVCVHVLNFSFITLLGPSYFMRIFIPSPPFFPFCHLSTGVPRHSASINGGMESSKVNKCAYMQYKPGHSSFEAWVQGCRQPLIALGDGKMAPIKLLAMRARFHLQETRYTALQKLHK